MDNLLTHRRLFSYFNLYRVLIGFVIFSITFIQNQQTNDLRYPEIYQLSTLAYLILNVGIYFYYRTYSELRSAQIFLSVSIDILVLHSIFYVGMGIGSGSSNLVVISICAANIMLKGRLGFAAAAMATLLSLGIEIERFLAHLSSVGSIASAGLLGLFYFVGAYIVQALSQRIRQSEDLAQEQQKNIQELQQLNHLIIQSMRTGIVVCDQDFSVRTMNQACEDLIGLSQGDELPEQLRERIQIWQSQPSSRTTPFKVNQNFPLVQANFSSLDREKNCQILIFIEDTRHLTQQAQQLKLASLGRLTASIAHEVRNPLGAISHATQLLNESENLDDADKKMLDIVTRHCSRMNRIIEDTLSLSRRAEPLAEEVQLTNWLTQFVNEYREQHPEIRLQFTHKNPDCLARFDQNQIEQVLVNLFDNGLRHGLKNNDQENLVVKLSQTENGEQAIIDVLNPGKTLAEDVRKHLFEPFFTTASQGTGLGLYLSKEICEANQAQLDYIEMPDDWICFRVLFAPPKRII